MTFLAHNEVTFPTGRTPKLARRRLQQKGHLFEQGGMWYGERIRDARTNHDQRSSPRCWRRTTACRLPRTRGTW